MNHRLPSATAVALAILFTLAAAPTALAHGYVIGGDPEPFTAAPVPPPHVAVHMNEPVDLAASSVRVLNRAGDAVSVGDSFHPGGNESRLAVRIPEDLANGTYTVAWRALWRSDGHLTSGFYAISIGDRPPRDYVPPDGLDDETGAAGAGLLDSAGRTLAFIGVILVPGTLLFGHVLLPPAWNAANQGDRVIRREAYDRARRSTRNLALLGIGVGVAGALILLHDQSSRIFETSGVAAFAGIVEVVESTSSGQLLALRGGLLVLSGLLLVTLRTAIPAFLAAIAALVSTSLVSHAAGEGGLVLASDIVHLAAASVWAGSLPALAMILPAAARRFGGDERYRLYGPLVANFSLLATVSIAAILVTGFYAAWVHVGSLEAMWTTPYGRLVLAKIGLVLPILVLGLLNKLVFTPAFSGRGHGHRYRAFATPNRFRRILAAEIVLVVAVLVLTGVLAGTSPRIDSSGGFLPPETRDGPLVIDSVGVNGVLDARIVIDPGEYGANTINVTLLPREGVGAFRADIVSLRATYVPNPSMYFTDILEHAASDAGDEDNATTPDPRGPFLGRMGFALEGGYEVAIRVQFTEAIEHRNSVAYDEYFIFTLDVPEFGPIALIEN